MAKTEQTKWVKTEAAVEQVDTGDILNPLRRVQARYLERAEKLSVAGHKANAEYYYSAALNVGSLLGDSIAVELRE